MPLRSNPKSVILWSLLLSPLVGALQQHSPNAHPPRARYDELNADDDGRAHSYGHGHGHGSASVADRRWSAPVNSNNNVGGAVPTPLSGQRGHRDTRVNGNQHSSLNERAIVTWAPAEANPQAVRALPAHWSSAGSAAGPSSRQTGRTLQDWQVEDTMLLATVDGKLHARDRRTGAPKWQLETNNSMIETTYHAIRETEDDDSVVPEDPLWIVEPSQDGSIYMFLPSSGMGVQKLDYTVKQLMDLTPFETQSDPPITYTAEKKTALYTVDAATGTFIKGADSSGTSTNDDGSCRRVSYMEPLEECEPIGTLTIGRTEYTIRISYGGRQLTTIRYSEWVHNNRDVDLLRNYTATMDSKYVYSKPNGTVFGVELSSNGKLGAGIVRKPMYSQELGSPVVRVFDVVRPIGDTSRNAALILPQPVDPYNDYLSSLPESIFVDCTELGSWYAMSEAKYPGVTRGATLAAIYNNGLYKLGIPSMAWPPSTQERGQFAGVHRLVPLDVSGHARIDQPNWLRIDGPPPLGEVQSQVVLVPETGLIKTVPLRTILIAALAALIILGTGGAAYKVKSTSKAAIELPIEVRVIEENIVELAPETVASVSVEKAVVDDRKPELTVIEPEKEIIFPHEALTPPEDVVETAAVEAEETATVDEAVELVQIDNAETQADKDEKQSPEPTEPKKKKGAHRGRRSGKKAKEKEQQQAIARADKVEQKAAARVEKADAPVVVRFEKNGQLLTPPPPVPVDSDPARVVGVLQINSLIIHTDRVIGQGSCGTSVFEGSFEGRAVAVKRMLSQYYELASQEVSFLQQSDDHPNVIRYFCQQRDDHFLYIAVELCQASLFEVWEPEKARTDERQKQLQTLKFTIQQDVPRALQQLAAGLYHLHNLRIIHRDIKPQNILVAFPKKNQNNGPQLVISDFGLGKNLPENVSTLVDPTGNAGTSGWKAPELISQPRETDSRHSQSNSQTGISENAVPGNGTSGVKRAADIFSLGCLFFWVLTDGIHPYEDENGWHQLRELNIKRDNKKMEVLERWSDAYEPMQLITSMLSHQPEDRPTALQVLNHPFFWIPAKRLAFLCDCSDHFEREPRGTWEDGYAGDSYALSTLESRAEEVIGAPFERADFLAKLDRLFVDTLGRQRKYSGNRLLDLLRALRNKKNHYEDMAEDVKRRVGPLPEGYLNTWCHRFPRLLMACYEVVYECGLEKSDRFKGYFDAGV